MGDLTPEEVQTINLRRQWGWQRLAYRGTPRVCWSEPVWERDEADARRYGAGNSGRRLVWRLVSDPVVDHG